MFKNSIVKILLCVLFIASTHAETVIKLTVGAAPGGITDIMARALQQTLIEETSLKLLIEYKPGAGGEIAHIHVANNKTEPNLILLYNSLVTLNAKENKNYNWYNDFVLINYLGYSPMVLVTSKESGINTWQDLKNWPENKSLSIAGGPTGSNIKVCGDLLMQQVKKDWISVDYKSGGPAIVDLIGGHHLIGCHNESAVRGYIDSGLLIPLASVGTSRLPSLPRLPSTEELGLKNSKIVTWHIIGANKMVDATTVEKIQKVMTQIMYDPAKRKKFSELSGHLFDVELTVGGTNAAVKFTESEIAKLKK